MRKRDIRARKRERKDGQRRNMIRLQKVETKDKDLLFNVMQKYIYEMTVFYNEEMDGKGNYKYEHFEDYFSDPLRTAYFIYNDETMVGFAMLCPYSNVGEEPDYTMAEFTIFPAFRKKRYAWTAANMILKKHPGKWEIKYHERNLAAKKLWTSIAGGHHPVVYRLNEEESVYAFDC